VFVWSFIGGLADLVGMACWVSPACWGP